MRYIFWVKVAAIHGLAAWSGLAAYCYFYNDLPVFWFRVGNIILAIFFTVLTTLVYAKFFHHFSVAVYGAIVLVMFAIGDFILIRYVFRHIPALFDMSKFELPTSQGEWLITYAVVAVTLGLSYSLYNKARA